MLVLTRKPGQTLIIDDKIIVRVIEVKGDMVKIGIEAPKEISVHRSEVYDDIKKENIQAVKSDKNALQELYKLF